MPRLLSDTVGARTLLVLVIGLTFSHVLSVGLYVTDRVSALRLTGGQHIAERVATITRIVANAAPSERQRIVDISDGDGLLVRLDDSGLVNSGTGDEDAARAWEAISLRDALASHLDPAHARSFRFRYLPETGVEEDGSRPGFLVSVPIDSGQWLAFEATVEPASPFWSFRFVLSLSVMLIAVAGLSALVVHHLTRPLRDFAMAARRLGVDVNAPPLPETGPGEVRQVAAAFNQMQDRLRRFIDDRTQMIAAISHDLGTPITRLRLRAEFVEDADEQRKMLADLSDMEKMVSSVLAFARDEADREQAERIDLHSVLQRICDDLADAGHAVELHGDPVGVPVIARPVAMRRALTNLIDNAVRYGRRAIVSIEVDKTGATIRIEDDGPGIPADRVEDMFKPFRRLEPSRSRDTGGTGLGLTVARTVLRAHGGDVTLTNRPAGGLCATVRLPLELPRPDIADDHP